MFPNSYKQQGDRRPDYKGSININGTILDIAGWWKQSKSGDKTYLDIKVSSPAERPQQQGPAPAPQYQQPQYQQPQYPGNYQQPAPVPPQPMAAPQAPAPQAAPQNQGGLPF